MTPIGTFLLGEGRGLGLDESGPLRGSTFQTDEVSVVETCPLNETIISTRGHHPRVPLYPVLPPSNDPRPLSTPIPVLRDLLGPKVQVLGRGCDRVLNPAPHY